MAVGFGTEGRTAIATVNVRAMRAGNKAGDSLYRVPVSEIATDPEQPRKTFNGAEMEALTASIKQHGIINPVELRRDGEVFVLICGERRLRAAKLARLKTVPALVRAETSEQDRRVRQLVENIQRADLGVLELADGFQSLIDSGMKRKDLSKAVGKSPANISKVFRCGEFAADLPKDLREKVSRVKLSLRSLYECASMKPKKAGVALLRGLLDESPDKPKKSPQRAGNAVPGVPSRAQLTRAFKAMEAKEISAVLEEVLPARILAKVYQRLRSE